MSKLRADIDVAELERRSQGTFPGFVGLEMVRVEENRIVMRLALRSEHQAPNGYLHGAVVVALATSVQVYRIGDSGARAVWGGSVSAQG